MYKLIVEQWKATYKNPVAIDNPSAFRDDLRYFSVCQSALFRHSKVQNSAIETQRHLLVLELYNFLTFFIWAEQGPVTEVCAHMQAADYFIKLPKDLVDGANTVLRQESNHSKWAYNLLLEVEAFTGIVPLSIQPAFLNVMEKMIARDKSLEGLVKLFFVTIAELLDLGTTESVRHDAEVQVPVRAFADAHENEV